MKEFEIRMYNTVAVLEDTLHQVYLNPDANADGIIRLLSLEDPEELEQLFSFADNVRAKFMGEGILLRGIVEFSSFCDNNCFYCGLNNQNKALTRYRIPTDEILEAVANISASNIKTVVLQSGEDHELDPDWLADLVRTIKQRFDMAITLSVGEKPRNLYQLWREAGADRYLLKMETADPAIYGSAHSGRHLESRLQCLADLADLGYQVGSGLIVGLRGQTLETLARDILFFRQRKFDMIGIGPLIPHPQTVFAGDPPGSIPLTLKVLAVTRIVTRDTHLPATTALGSAGGFDYRMDGLKAGANVLMPNFTPVQYKKFYEIYPGKTCIDETSSKCLSCMGAKATSIGRFIDHSIGHSFKKQSMFHLGGDLR
jgi:biotin synthase